MNFLRFMPLFSIVLMIVLSNQTAQASIASNACQKSSSRLPVFEELTKAPHRLPVFEELTASHCPLPEICATKDPIQLDFNATFICNTAHKGRCDLVGALFESLKYKNEKLFHDLLSTGVSANELDSKEYSLLHYAVYFGDIESVKLLLSWGIRITYSWNLDFKEQPRNRLIECPDEMALKKDRPPIYFNREIDEQIYRLLGGPSRLPSQ